MGTDAHLDSAPVSLEYNDSLKSSSRSNVFVGWTAGVLSGVTKLLVGHPFGGSFSGCLGMYVYEQRRLTLSERAQTL
jgi:hypothetical protein